MGGRWHSEEPQDETKRVAGFMSKNHSELLPSQEASAQGGSHSLSVQSRGQAWWALWGDAFSHRLLLTRSSVVCVVRAAAASATATATASGLLEQQHFPVGFVVREMA